MKNLIATIIFCSISIQTTKSQNSNKDLIGDWWTITECGKCNIELKYPYQEISFNDSFIIFYSFCNSSSPGHFKIKTSDNNSYTVSYQGKDYATKFQKKDESTLILTGICLDTNMEISWILKRIDKKEYALSNYIKDKDFNKYITQSQKRYNKIKIEQ